jgi:hypothetical protein
MWVTCPSETSVNFYKSTFRNSPEGDKFYSLWRGNLSSHEVSVIETPHKDPCLYTCTHPSGSSFLTLRYTTLTLLCTGGGGLKLAKQTRDLSRPQKKLNICLPFTIERIALSFLCSRGWKSFFCFETSGKFSRFCHLLLHIASCLPRAGQSVTIAPEVQSTYSTLPLTQVLASTWALR